MYCRFNLSMVLLQCHRVKKTCSYFVKTYAKIFMRKIIISVINFELLIIN